MRAKLWPAVLILLMATHSAYTGFAEGLAAYERGDDATALKDGFRSPIKAMRTRNSPAGSCTTTARVSRPTMLKQSIGGGWPLARGMHKQRTAWGTCTMMAVVTTERYSKTQVQL